MIILSKFSENLSYLRRRSGLSQQELAEKSGCSRSAIGMYETGKREPDIETLEAFADIFNVDMDFLTGRVESSEWSIRFRKKLSEILETANHEDLIASGINLRDAELVVAGSTKLSFDYACDIIDALGVSFDYMLSRDSDKNQINQRNMVRIAARNGNYYELTLSDKQLSALNAFIDLLPDASNDL